MARLLRRPCGLLSLKLFQEVLRFELSLPTFSSKIVPKIESYKQYGPYYDEGSGKFEINDFLDIVDDERTRVCQ